MIFVLAGILILIVSFVVAFVSLVREQTKYEKKIKFDTEEKDEDKTVLSKSASKATAKVLEKQEDLDETTLQHEPFPWEDPEATLKVYERLGDRTIEEIHAELAQMAKKRSESQQAQILEDEEDDDDYKAGKSRLSGEISLSDFRKQSS